jgi:phosphoribosylformylglycinamidine synthase
LAETAIAGGLGARVDVKNLTKVTRLKDYQLLFSESQVRFVVEVVPENRPRFEKLVKKADHYFLGRVGGLELSITEGRKQLVKIPIGELKEAWQKTFKGWYA